VTQLENCGQDEQSLDSIGIQKPARSTFKLWVMQSGLRYSIGIQNPLKLLMLGATPTSNAGGRLDSNPKGVIGPLIVLPKNTSFH